MAVDIRDIGEAIDFRRKLHRYPDVSGEEAKTADAVLARLAEQVPDRLLSGLGGHGVAAVFEGSAPGPTVLLRSELDAPPIGEVGAIEHRSRTENKGHLCGHDGHSATAPGSSPSPMRASASQPSGSRRNMGEMWATLRALQDEAMQDLVAEAEAIVVVEARTAGLDCAMSYHELLGPER